MIRVRTLMHSHRRCDGCGATATAQLGFYAWSHTPLVAWVDLCETCVARLVKRLDRRVQRSALKKLGVK